MFKTINYDEWDLFGGGVTADSYYKKDDDTIMLKLFAKNIELEIPKREYDIAKTAQDLGLPVPAVYEMVESDDGRYGVIFERVKDKKSIGKAISDDPEHIEDYVELLIKAFRPLSEINIKDSSLTPYSEKVFPFIEGYKDLYSSKDIDNIVKFVNDNYDEKNCVHGDFHTGNVIIANKKSYLIDLADLSYGTSAIDIGSMYLIYKIWPGKRDERLDFIFHVTPEQALKCWDIFSENYLELHSQEQKDEFGKHILPYAAIDSLVKTARANFLEESVKITTMLLKQSGLIQDK